jgi:hypothetical protein
VGGNNKKYKNRGFYQKKGVFFKGGVKKTGFFVGEGRKRGPILFQGGTKTMEGQGE